MSAAQKTKYEDIIKDWNFKAYECNNCHAIKYLPKNATLNYIICKECGQSRCT